MQIINQTNKVINWGLNNKLYELAYAHYAVVQQIAGHGIADLNALDRGNENKIECEQH